MRMRDVMLYALFSKPSLAGRGVLCILIILYLYGVIRMPYIDAQDFGILDEYIIPMMVFAIIGAFLAAIYVRRHCHDIAAYDDGYENPYDLAYDKKYDFATFLSFVFGAAVGVISSPALTNAVIANAGMWSYSIMGGAIAIVVTVFLVYAFHFGVRKWLIKTKKYFLNLIDTVQDVVDEIKDKLDDGEVNGSVTGGTEVTDAINGAITATTIKATQPTTVKAKKG